MGHQADVPLPLVLRRRDRQGRFAAPARSGPADARAPWQQAKQFITDRQIGRRALVGSTEQNRPVIEQSYDRLLDAARTAPDRPAVPARRATRARRLRRVRSAPPARRLGPRVRPHRRAPRASRSSTGSNAPTTCRGGTSTAATGWCDRTSIPTTTIDLLGEIGRTYAPFMLANAAAIDAGAAEVVCEIDDHEYRQGTFVYQHKCLAWLRGRVRRH